jgi:hypothetical protein
VIASSRFPYSTRTQTQEGQKLAADGTKRKGHFGSFRDGWARAEHIIVLPLDGA